MPTVFYLLFLERKLPQQFFASKFAELNYPTGQHTFHPQCHWLNQLYFVSRIKEAFAIAD